MSVISFPTRAVRDWITIESAAKVELGKLGMPDDAQRELLFRMKAFYDLLKSADFTFTVDTSFPSSLSEEERNAICADIAQKVSTAIGEKLAAFTLDLFGERSAREVEIHQSM